MAIRYECNQCGSVLKIKDDLAGKPGKCPKCKQAFTVPAAEDESDNTRDAADESSDASTAAESKSRSSGSGDDFDVDAFLLEEGDSDAKPKAAPVAKKAKDVDADQSLDDADESDGNSKAKNSKTRSDRDSGKDSFEIRRGPDAPGKNLPPMTSGLQDDADETPAPSRRPPGTNPDAGASNIASDLLSKSAKKGKKANWDEVQPPQKEEGPLFDWSGLIYEAKTKLLPVAGGGAVLCLLAYFVVFPMLGSKGYSPMLTPVTGTIKLNGKPLVGAEIWFYPEKKQEDSKGKSHKVSASRGITDATGRYELIYDQDHKGVASGTCRIEIVVAPTEYAGILKKYYRPDRTERPATVEVKLGNTVIDLELSQ